MRKFLMLLGIGMCMCNMLLAQTGEISGKVTDPTGSPIPSATIRIKGSKKGTSAGSDGSFKLTAPLNTVLVVTGIGFDAVEVKTTDFSTQLSVVLRISEKALSEVVVTALGIRREKKALGYAVSTIDKKDIELKAEGDLGRILNGKAPGVNILGSSGLSGSGTNITIRGVSTITGNATPLFVIDGVPFDAGTNTKASFVYGNQTSSRFLDIDPNNIESVNILKGLSATTIYGEAGRNGVILITTKSGSTQKNRKKAEITVSQSFFANKVANLPEYNTSYGGGFDLSLGLAFFSNWGAKFTNPPTKVAHPYSRAALNAAFPEYIGATYDYKFYNSVEKFFKTGLISTTSINAAGSSGPVNYNASYGYTDDQGFVIGNGMRRNNFSLGGTARLSDKFTVSGTLNYVITDVKSPPTSTSFGSSATVTSVFGDVLYTPTAVDLMGLPWESPLDHSAVYYRSSNDIQNPRWTLYNAFTEDKVNRSYGNLSIKYDLMKGLNLMYRAGFDNYTEFQSYGQNKGGHSYATGIYRTSTGLNTIWDHTIFATYNKDLTSKLNLNVEGGFNSREITYSQTGNLSTTQLVYGLMDHSNFVAHDIVSEDGTDLDYTTKSQSLGTFAAATLGYDQYLFLNIGGRNSWSSTLEKANRSIFYPSASLSFVPTSVIPALQNSQNVNYLKLRVGYATSAAFPDPYATRPVLAVATRAYLDRSGTAVNVNAISNTLPNPDLKPELQEEVEAGIEGKFINSRVSLDVTFYDRTSKNQILDKSLDPASGYTSQKVNAGQVRNKGIEMRLGYAIIQNKSWLWQVDGIYTLNKSMVSDIPAGLGEVAYAGYSNLGNFAINGQPLGVIKGTYFQREAKTGQRIVGATGDYETSSDIGIIGDPNPHYKLSGVSTLSYKGISFRMQWDYTCGGAMYSATSSVLLGRGVTKDTEFDRAAPYILPGVDANGNTNKVQTSATEAYFDNTIAGGAASEAGIYDATVIRLREASLSYSLPEKMLSKLPFGSISFSLSGTNLWYYAPNFPKYVHFDPETSGLGVSNGKGLEFFTGPSSRRMGASIRVTF